MADSAEPISEFAWQDRISSFQKLLLKVSSLVGFLIFFGGVQLTVRGKAEIGGWIAGFGMFIAAQMRWGIKSLYNTIERKAPGLLERFGYGGMFWLLFVAAFLINCVGIVTILLLVTDYLTTGELPPLLELFTGA